MLCSRCCASTATLPSTTTQFEPKRPRPFPRSSVRHASSSSTRRALTASTASTDEGVLRRVSQCLKGAELRGGDFADICADAAEGDFVYFDPPYITRRAARIIRYQPGSFYEADHRRLARYVRELDMRGCFVMVSNSEHPLVLKLYQGFRIDSLDVRRKVNADATARGGWRELLIRNFDQRGNLLTRRRMRTPQLCLPWS